MRWVVGVSVLLRVAALASGESAAAALGKYRLVEIARGHSWVSPYWGYSAPKIAGDGRVWYTAGLWGTGPETAEGIVYKCENGAWREGARLPGVYQPAAVLLDRRGRLLVAYTRQGRPIRLLRAKAPGGADVFDDLPVPPDMPNAYYIGAAVGGDTLHLAWLVSPEYMMLLATLDLASLQWWPAVVLCEGQVRRKPKTAWTYPILFPAADGLHVVASNCPDGGEGNTYNQVWYSHVPAGASRPAIRELVADCPMGHVAYAMDMLVDAVGAVHVVFMWNSRGYGDPLPKGRPAEGTWHARRDSKTGRWDRIRIGPVSIAGFYGPRDGLFAVTTQEGTLVPLKWRGIGQGWEGLPPLCDRASIPASPSFMDVISRAGGNDLSRGMAVVADGLLPATGDQPEQRVLWSLLSEGP